MNKNNIISIFTLLTLLFSGVNSAFSQEWEAVYYSDESIEACDYEEAVEFIDYNTVPACPYMGSNAPIILRNITDYINIRNNG